MLSLKNTSLWLCRQDEARLFYTYFQVKAYTPVKGRANVIMFVGLQVNILRFESAMEENFWCVSSAGLWKDHHVHQARLSLSEEGMESGPCLRRYFQVIWKLFLSNFFNAILGLALTTNWSKMQPKQESLFMGPTQRCLLMFETEDPEWFILYSGWPCCYCKWWCRDVQRRGTELKQS